MGLVVLGWMAWAHPSFIIWLVLILSLPRIFSLFRNGPKRAALLRSHGRATLTRCPRSSPFGLGPSRTASRGLDWTMAAMYFGLIAALVFGMRVALAQLQGHGIHPETRTHVQ